MECLQILCGHTLVSSETAKRGAPAPRCSKHQNPSPQISCADAFPNQGYDSTKRTYALDVEV